MTAVMTGAARRRAQSRQEMREAILGAARELVAEQGLDGLSMRAVAGRLGYSAAALYEYYPSKEDLLRGLYFEGAEGLGGRLQGAVRALSAETPTAEVFAALGHAYRDYALTHPDLYRILFGELACVPPPPEGEPQTGFDVLVAAAARGVERGEMAPQSPPVIACAAWALVHGFVHLELTGHLLGGDGPGVPPPSPAEGRTRRDALFAATLQFGFYGFIKR